MNLELLAGLAGLAGVGQNVIGDNLHPVAIGALVLGGGMMAFHYWRHSSEENSARFGNDNISWKIALLRRYLFHMHRCGIEPVLVVDELDKLECDSRNLCGKLLVSAQDKKPVKGEKDQLHFATENVPAQEDKIKPLEEFLRAMLRVKHSLGADFFWVLVGGIGLYECIAYARRDNTELGVLPLATLSQQEMMLGPVGLDAAIQFLERDLPPDPRKDLPPDPRAHALTWLSAQGTYSNLRRLAEEETVGFNTAGFSIAKINAYRIAVSLNQFWEPDKMEILALEVNPEFYVDKNLVYLRMGMLAFGLEALRGNILPVETLEAAMAQALTGAGIAEPGEDHIRKALSLGSPRALWHLGRLLASSAIAVNIPPQPTV